MSDTYIDIVFDAPPGPVCGRFVETEDPSGSSINSGEWVHREDGYWALRVRPEVFHRIRSMPAMERTRAVLERVFDERCRQMELHGTAMDQLSDGTGPDVRWLPRWNDSSDPTAAKVQRWMRRDYEDAAQRGELTRMHLVREEIAEAFERSGDDPRLADELLQVAALCVQWVEILDSESTHA